MYYLLGYRVIIELISYWIKKMGNRDIIYLRINYLENYRIILRIIWRINYFVKIIWRIIYFVKI